MDTATQAPTFSTAASTGQTLSSESFTDKVPLLMLFIPNLDEAAATLNQYNEAHDQIGKRRTQLIVVAPETASRVREVAEDQNLTFPILADPSRSIFRDYDAVDGNDKARACSVVVDRTGTVAAVTAGVGTPEESLALLEKASDQFEMAVER